MLRDNVATSLRSNEFERKQSKFKNKIFFIQLMILMILRLLAWMTARLQQDTFLSWHIAPTSEVTRGLTLPF
jgi:hypothetical protein